MTASGSSERNAFFTFRGGRMYPLAASVSFSLTFAGRTPSLLVASLSSRLTTPRFRVRRRFLTCAEGIPR